MKKYRALGLQEHTGVHVGYGQPLSGNGEKYRFATQLHHVDTRGNPYHLLGKVRRDIGGYFVSKKYDVVYDRGQSTHRAIDGAGNVQREVHTHLFPSSRIAGNLSQIATVQTPSQMSARLDKTVPAGLDVVHLTALGTKAVAMFSPLNPVADTSTTIAEFISERKLFNVPGTAGSLPGEYLNYMFGIAPTVGYAQDLREAIRDKEKILAQLSRDSGRWVRRKGVVFEESEVIGPLVPSYQPVPGTIGPSLSSALARGGRLLTITRRKTRVWFSGAFTYYLPKEGSTWRTVAELDKLYGVKIGVDTAWELLPFSWLVDYKTSAGAALSNLSAFSADGLVMPYGYVMCEQSEETESTWTGETKTSSGSWLRTELYARETSVSKQRLAANPFGFGILPGDLSGRQLSILAALGLTYLK